MVFGIQTVKGSGSYQCYTHRNFELKNVDSETKVFTNKSGNTFRAFEIFFKKLETEFSVSHVTD